MAHQILNLLDRKSNSYVTSTPNHLCKHVSTLYSKYSPPKHIERHYPFLSPQPSLSRSQENLNSWVCLLFFRGCKLILFHLWSLNTQTPLAISNKYPNFSLFVIYILRIFVYPSLTFSMHPSFPFL